MGRGSLVRRVRHWVANRGWRGFLVEALRRGRVLAREGRRGLADTITPPRVHPFDQRYGVETSGLIWGEKLGSAELAAVGSAGYWATGYYGISPSVFGQAMERLGLEWGRYTFVDVGCGKGRALMLAMRYPFRRVVGVELAAELAEVARGNLERFRAEWRLPVCVEVVVADATTVPLPGGPLVVYLYHPFAAPVMRRFLEHLEAAVRREGREVWLLYVNPELDGMLRARAGMERMWEEFFAMGEEDVVADRFGSQWERMVAYRVR